MSKLTTITLPDGSTYDLGEGEANQNAFSTVYAGTYGGSSIHTFNAASPNSTMYLAENDNVNLVANSWTDGQGNTQYTLNFVAGKPSKSPWITKVACPGNVMLFQKDLTSLTPSTTMSGTGTSKTLSEVEFYAHGVYGFYDSWTSLSAQAQIPDGTIAMQKDIDLRYSFNMRSNLTVNQSVFLVCTPANNGKCKFYKPSTATANLPITQSIPGDVPSADQSSVYYIYLGNATGNKTMELMPVHPVYQYIGGKTLPPTSYGRATVLSPTPKTGMTNNRSHFVRFGPLVFVHFSVTISETYASNTTLFTDLPAADSTSDIMAQSSGSTFACYVNSSGQLKNNGAWAAGSYIASGWYYSPS